MVYIVRFEAQGRSSGDWDPESEDVHGGLGRYWLVGYLRAHQIVRMGKYRYIKLMRLWV